MIFTQSWKALKWKALSNENFLVFVKLNARNKNKGKWKLRMKQKMMLMMSCGSFVLFTFQFSFSKWGRAVLTSVLLTVRFNYMFITIIDISWVMRDCFHTWSRSAGFCGASRRRNWRHNRFCSFAIWSFSIETKNNRNRCRPNINWKRTKNHNNWRWSSVGWSGRKIKLN